jgi:hypothetical protein
MKLQGVNFDLDDGYCKILGKTAMSIGGNAWLQPGTDGFMRVETARIFGGVETCLEIDRKNGVIDRLALVEMSPEFTLLMLQKHELLYEHFIDAAEGNGFIRLSSVRFGDIETVVSITSRLPVAMRTVDAAGAAL